MPAVLTCTCEFTLTLSLTHVGMWFMRCAVPSRFRPRPSANEVLPVLAQSVPPRLLLVYLNDSLACSALSGFLRRLLLFAGAAAAAPPARLSRSTFGAATRRRCSTFASNLAT